jgi:hypothetical protein
MNKLLLLSITAGLLYLGSCSPDPMMGDFDLKLIGGYRLARESRDSVEVYHESDPKCLGVPRKVVQIALNNRLILAKQQELRPRADFPGDTLLVPVPGKYYFWIIDTMLTNRLGPMSEPELREKLKTLSETNLVLEEVSKFRNLRRDQKK